MKNALDSIQDVAGCLGAMPSRAGMTAIGSLMAMKQYAADGKAVVVDVGTSGDLVGHHLIMGSTRTGMSQFQTHDHELVARATALGVIGSRFLTEPKEGWCTQTHFGCSQSKSEEGCENCGEISPSQPSIITSREGT